VAARTAPPQPSPILVPVESRVLSLDVVTRGTVRFGLPQPISIAPSTIKGGIGLIARLPRPNEGFQEGQVILSISGRPVFVLRGATPAYRDMSPRTSGGDVRQLEEALERLGFDPGTVDGVYDQKTAAAVERWYRKAGWDPFGPTREQRAAILALERDWSDAERSRLAAEAAHQTAMRALETERARAAHSATTADADVAAQIAERAIIELDPRQTETARAAAEARLKVARAAQRKAKLESDLAIQTAKQQSITNFNLKVASERAEQLERELAAARARLGVQVPADEVVFIPSLPVRVHEVTASVGASPTGPVMSVTDNQISIDSQLPIASAPLVKPGMKVAIEEQAVGIKATGVVETVANTPGTRGVDGYHFYLGVRVESAPVSLVGFSVRLTIPIETSKGAVTAVPTSAVSLAVDGKSRVLVDRDGVQEYVTVQPGLSAGGYVEVTALDGRLVPGQFVVVGQQAAEPGG
jgi:peptidoglycan hydrolase-like protein with peptidoglycan-binding domain